MDDSTRSYVERELVILDDVWVGIDPDEAAEIIRACCRTDTVASTGFGVAWLKVEPKRLTACVHVRLAALNCGGQDKTTITPGKTWEDVNADEVFLFARKWLEERAAEGKAAYRDLANAAAITPGKTWEDLTLVEREKVARLSAALVSCWTTRAFHPS